MGKTPNSRDSNSRRNSSSSSGLNKTLLQSSVSTHKNMLCAKKMHNKQRKSIQRIFEKLIEQNSAETKVNEDSSVVLIEDSHERTSPSKKRRKSSKHNLNQKMQKTANESCVVINDDDDDDDLIISDSPCTKTSKSSIQTLKKLESPAFSSTPIHSRKTSKLNISNVSNIQNNLSKTDTITSNKTKEINPNSFLTIDLTDESNNTKKSNSINNTVIDLDNHDRSDCTFVSANSSLSMSGDSDVTIVNARKQNKRDKMQVFAKGIAKMSAREKGRLLELITKNIFTGCQSPTVASNTSIKKAAMTRATETVEDAYIKEIILGPSKSRNSVGSNIYNPLRDPKNKKGLRMIIVDGSNVAMEHGNGKMFSVKGLKICIDYFLKRGHVVKAFVPRFRCKYGKSTDPRLLDELERRGLVVYTPSRELPGKFICSYDDRYIVQCAAEFDGVIVSGDNYRDLMSENARWRFVIENRLLPFTWVNDMIMFPKDPLGRNGPTLDMFLKHCG